MGLDVTKIIQDAESAEKTIAVVAEVVEKGWTTVAAVGAVVTDVISNAPADAEEAAIKAAIDKLPLSEAVRAHLEDKQVLDATVDVIAILRAIFAPKAPAAPAVDPQPAAPAA